MESNNNRQHMIGRPIQKTLHGSRGAALIPIIIAIVVIAGIGALLLSLSTVGTFNPILGNSADRAYYLAESGFRYAAMTYQHGGADQLDAINNQTYPIDTNQTFTLRFRTYKLEADGGGNVSTLTALPAFGLVPQVPEGSVSGYLKVGNRNAREFSSVNINANETEISITRSSGNWNVSNRAPVRFAALSDGSTVSEGGDLQLQSGTRALDFFPKYNGQFTAEGMVYRYKVRDTDTHRLLGVTRVDGTWTAPDLNPNEAVVLNDFVVLHSTGRYGQGFFGATRQLTYYIPFSAGSGGNGFRDNFDNMDHWGDNGASAEGDHDIQDQNGNALAVTNTSNLEPQNPNNLLESSLIGFDWASTNLDFAAQWQSSGRFLSYDTQVKIRADEPAFMDGISFNMDENSNSYGISFLKAADNNEDGILDSLVPQPPGQTMVVLWQRNGTDWQQWRWLAYYTLPLDNYISGKTFFEDDMESGESKWDTYGGEWEQISYDAHSGQYCWHNQAWSGGCGSDDFSRLASISFNLSDASNPQLSFWHHYRVGSADAGIEISTDQGDSWEGLEEYHGNRNSWTQQTIDLSDYAGQDDVRIRFGLERGGGSWDPDWYVDDVKVYEAGLNWPTLMISAREARSITFYNGDTSLITDGATVTGESSGASATVYGDPVLAPNSPSGSNAFGDMLLRHVSGSFEDNEALFINGEECATVDTIHEKQNYIRAYIGDQEEHGSPGNPLDRERLASPRGEVNWPPLNVQDTDATNDYFTLIQWNEDVDNSVTRMGSGEEQDAVIRTDTLTTPSSGSFPLDRPELGLHTWGWGSVDGEPTDDVVPNIYFDDFAVRMPGEKTSPGFAPAIQESTAGE